MGDLDTKLSDQCIDSLRWTWGGDDSDIPNDLWNWSYLVDSNSATKVANTIVVEAAQGIMEGMVTQEGSMNTSVARHLTALLASGTVANLNQTTWEDGCKILNDTAQCALMEYPNDTCGQPGPPPPPEGNEPDAFCQAANTIARTPFYCVSSPLSQALSFITMQPGTLNPTAQSSNLWLTVTTSASSQAGMLWWPVWLAAYAANAPSLMLFEASTGEKGVLVVHSIEVQAYGPKAQVQKFWSYVDGQLAGTTAPAPDWTKLSIVMPSAMQYQVVTGYDTIAPQSTSVITWAPGANLTLPNLPSVAWKFKQLVGIIDPCRSDDRESSSATGESVEARQEFCRLRVEAWVNVANSMLDNNHTLTFDALPYQSCLPANTSP